MMYLELKKRIPEPEEEMEGESAFQYFKAKYKPGRRSTSYSIVTKDIFKRIPLEKGKVLDIGCGYGALISHLHMIKPRLSFIGIDSSNFMIKTAKKYMSDKNILFVKARADKLPYKNGVFDLVVCKDTFHHFISPEKVLREMYRVTKKGGHIYITDLRRDSDMKIILSEINEIARTNITHARLYIDSIKASYTIGEMQQLFKKAKIKKYEIWNAKITKNFFKEYRVSRAKRLSATNFIKDRWIAVITK
ncbi:MAG: class I SAM-dependent methyltransferase [Candidatus Aenigmarchaeota archaeon]|nr:class I SAM-dependent methyltransferase [Candidatus Aenigmarchaeota archaeon]